MPHQSLKLIAGVDQNRTPALNETAISYSNLIRFIPDRQNIGLVQKLGGWTRYLTTPISSVVRCLLAWEDTNGRSWLGVGAETSLSVVTGAPNGVPKPITPQTTTVDVAVLASTTLTTPASTSTNFLATLNATNSGLDQYDSVYIKTQISVGGVVLFGVYPVIPVSTNQFEVQITNTLGQPLSAAFATTTLSVSSVSWALVSGVNTATLNYTGPYTFTLGSVINVTGLVSTNPSPGFNGSFIVTASTTTSVSYALDTDPGTRTSGGTIDNYGNVPIFDFTVGSAAITVTLANHGYSVGSTFPALTPTTANNVTLSGNLDVSAVTDPVTGATSSSSFTIVGPGAVTSTPTLSATGDGTYATLTFSSSVTTPIGSTIVVSNVAPSGYNGTYVVTATGTASGTNYVRYANTTTAAQTTSGSLYVKRTRLNSNQATTTTPNGFAEYVYYNGVGPLASNVGYGVGGYGGSSSFSITGATISGTTATVNFSGSYTAPIGSYINVSGVTPTGYNGSWVVTVSSSGQVKYEIPTSTPGTSGTGGVVAYGGGYGSGVPPTSGAGTSITAVDWTLDNWGETFLACPLLGGIYEWSPTVNNDVATIIPQAPPINDGMFVSMPQRQIIAWGSTFNGVQDLLLIRWCEVNDYNSWIALPTNQAGSFRIPKGSRIVQCIQGPQQGLIWTDLGCWAMQYVGLPYVYQFNELGTGCGLIGRKAAGSMGGVVYWMGQSQFFKLSGNGVEPILCPVWDVIFQDLDRNNLDKIRVAANSRFNEISWYYPTQSNGGEINAYVKYNIGLNQWDYGTLSRTAWINESVLGPPIGAGILPGGTGNYLIQHETSTDGTTADGTAYPLDSFFETGYFALSEADVKMFIDPVWPDMKWGYYGGSQGANVKLTFFATDYAGTAPTQYGPFTLTEATTFVTPRLRGRLVAIKIEGDPTQVGAFWRLGNMRYRIQQDGKY